MLGGARKRWLGQRSLVALVAGLVAAAVLGVALGYLALAQRELEATAVERTDQHALVLEHLTQRVLQQFAQVMLQTGHALEPGLSTYGHTPLGDTLAQRVARSPGFRSLSLLNESGVVIASSEPRSVGQHRTIIRRDHPRSESDVAVGDWWPGSTLVAAAAAVTTTAVPSSEHGDAAGSLTLWLSVKPLGRGPPVQLLGLIEPEAITSQYASLLGEAAVHSALFSRDAELLLRGSRVAAAPGSRNTALLPFSPRPAAKWQTSYVAKGIDGAAVVGSFRTLRQWPLVVVAEQGYDNISTELSNQGQRVSQIVAIAWLIIGSFALVMQRGLQRDQQARLELKLLHDEVVRSEDRWKLALDGAGDGVWDWQIDSGTLLCTTRLQSMLGYAPGEIAEQAQAWASLIHPQDAPNLQANIADHLAGRLPTLRGEIRVRSKTGSWRWVLLRGTAGPQRDARGCVTRIVGTVTDISDQRVAQEALLQSQARRQAVLQSSLDAIVTIDRDSLIIDFNHVAEIMFGLPQQEAVGLSLRDFIVQREAHEPQTEGLVRRYSSGQWLVLNQRIETEAVRLDGSRFPIELTMVPVRFGADEIFTATLRDISERRAVEVERQMLLHRYRVMATELDRQRLALDKHALVSIADANGVIQYANSLLCKVSGFTEDELLGQAHGSLRSGVAMESAGRDDTQAWSNQEEVDVRTDLRAHIQSGLVWQGELVHRTKSGSPFWTASTIVPMLNEEGGLQQVFVIQTDISQRITAERAAAKARDMELHIGARIQQSLLATLPDQRLPKTWLTAHSRASQGIDGDFMHVLTVGEHCVDVIAADVMGKGIGAALIAAAAKMQLSQCMAELMADSIHTGVPEPRQVVAALHKALVPNLLALEAFITLSYMRIDSQANVVTWIGCGHEPPLLVRVDGSCESLQNQHPPMGVLERVTYEQETTAMHQGDALFACSDGISDAVLADGTRIGRAAVEHSVRRLLAQCTAPAAVVHALVRDLMQPGVRAVDDMTIMLALRTDDTQRASRRELPYQLDALQHVRGLVSARCTEAGLLETEAGLFTVACVEAFTNIVRHSQGRCQLSVVELLVLRQPSCLVVEFIYLAEPVVLPTPQDPVLEAYPEGGFGLRIMREASDTLEHLHGAGINTIRLTKRCRA
jgi:PAS domain S-box-containing protein